MMGMGTCAHDSSLGRQAGPWRGHREAGNARSRRTRAAVRSEGLAGSKARRRCDSGSQPLTERGGWLGVQAGTAGRTGSQALTFVL